MTNVFVFDTNTLISTYLSPSSISRMAFDKARELGILIYSEPTINEFTETFVRPKFDKYISIETRLGDIEAFKISGELFDVTIIINECRDPKDNKFLELAVEAGAACIVTGDKDLLVLNPFRNIPILTAADFLRIY